MPSLSHSFKFQQLFAIAFFASRNFKHAKIALIVSLRICNMYEIDSSSLYRPFLCFPAVFIAAHETMLCVYLKLWFARRVPGMQCMPSSSNSKHSLYPVYRLHKDIASKRKNFFGMCAPCVYVCATIWLFQRQCFAARSEHKNGMKPHFDRVEIVSNVEYNVDVQSFSHFANCNARSLYVALYCRVCVFHLTAGAVVASLQRISRCGIKNAFNCFERKRQLIDNWILGENWHPIRCKNELFNSPPPVNVNGFGFSTVAVGI